MVRKLALSLAVAAAMGTSQALALGLGEIRVNSALNEPLNAEIQLLQVRDLSPLQIRPRMADVDEFSLAGLTKSRFLSDVQFQVQVGPNGQGTISVTSSVPVQEPFLSFLMEVNWPSGRLVREYTLLLDPPVFAPAPAATVVTAPQARVRPQAPTPAQPVVPAPRSEVHTVRTDMNRQAEVYIDINDTLYEIARDHRPSADISIEQMMIALQRKNPQAFPSANINIMKAGTVMRLPTSEEARALTRRQAIAETARQTAEWKAGRRSAQSAPAPAPAADDEEESGAPGVQAGGQADRPESRTESQLTIVTPAEEESVRTDSPEGAEAAPSELSSTGEQTSEGGPREQELLAKNAELENRLLVTQEAVAAVERDNADLGEKLDAIQEQLVALQRLIELKDQQMATLQMEMLRQSQAEKESEGNPFSDLLNLLMQNPLYLGGAGGVLLLLLALIAMRRRKSGQAEELPEPKPARKKAKSDKAEKADSNKDEKETSDQIPEFEEPASAAPAAAAGVIAGAAAAAAVQADEPDEVDQALSELDQLDDLDDDLADLDLDMDLDLDESPDISDIDDSPLEAISDISEEAVNAEVEIDSMLDDILDESEESAPKAEEHDELDDLLGSDLDTEIDDLVVTDEELEAEMAELEAAEAAEEGEQAGEPEEDEELEFRVEPRNEEEPDEAESEELEGLEFAVDSEEPEQAPEAADDFIDEAFFDEEIPEETGLLEPTPEAEPEDLLDELIETDERPPSADRVSSEGDLDDLLDDELDRMLAENAASLAQEQEPEPEEVLVEAEVGDLAEMPEASDDEALDFNLTEIDELESEAPLVNEAVDETEDEVPVIAEEVPEVLDQPEQAEEEHELGDLDDLINGLGAVEEEPVLPRRKSPGELVEDELTANIAHDLDLTLDDELDQILDSADSEVELVEEGGDDDLEDDLGSGFELLDGADEVETKLDLARAYIEMDDFDGARDILEEVNRDGSETQQAEAQKLLDKLN